MNFLRTNGFRGVVCGGLAVVADQLFFRRPVGVSLAIFGALLLGVLVMRYGVGWRRGNTGRETRATTGVVARVAFWGMAGLLVALVKEPRPLAVMLACGALGTFVIGRQSGRLYTLRAWVGRWIFLVLEVGFRFVGDQKKVAMWFVRHPRLFPRWFKVAGVWVLPVLAGGFFLLLFVAGNPVIGEGARVAEERMMDVLRTIPQWVSFGRVVLWGMVGAGGWGLLRASRRHRERPVGVPAIPRPPMIVGEIGLVIRCLTVFNVVFLIESVVDIVYLWGGAALPKGMTYTEFAHRAAYPLVGAALLAAGFVLMVFRRNGPGLRSSLARGLVYAWLVQNAFLTVSTFWRLKLYVYMYGLTWLRVSAAVWAGLIVAGMLWIVAKIAWRKSNTWLVYVNLATLAAVLYGAAFVNWEGMMAGFNIRHCSEVTGVGGELDVGYLEGMGPAALPALVEIRPKLKGEKREEAGKGIARLTEELNEELSDWRGWTWERGKVGRGVLPGKVVGMMGEEETKD